MSNKKTISVPANVGSNMLSEIFGRITFSNEVKELLSAIDAELTVRYVPGGEKPIIEILGKTGKKVCSLEEFKSLSGYRRFVSDTLKEVDKDTSTEEKIKLISYFLRHAVTQRIIAPTRILEQNYTKFNQIGGTLQNLAKHQEIVDGTIDNVWKIYIQENLARVTRILYTAQTKCMGPEVLAKDYVETQLFNMGIPKWIYNKFLDKNFTNNLKNDCMTLVFPKNNYLKSIAFSTKELNAEPFMTANKVVLVKSGGIIALSRYSWTALFPEFTNGLEEQIKVFLESYQWVLTNPHTVDEILTLRETGKMPPAFKEAQPPRRTGKDQQQRPETELGKICRQVSNVLGHIQATWNGILNFVIPVANPRTDFWLTLFADAKDWDITPTNSIYNCIRNEANKAPLDALRNGTSKAALQRIANIVASGNRIPAGSEHCQLIKAAFLSIYNKQAFRQDKPFDDTINRVHPLQALDNENHPATEAEISAGKTFLGIRENKSSKKNKRSGASGVRLDSSVLNELRPLQAHPIYDQVVTWLMTTFKTGERRILQKIAAERILGEAIKHQDTIFGSELGIEDYEGIEAYYEDEEY